MDTRVEVNLKYHKDDDELLFVPTITRPDIFYAVNLVSPFMTLYKFYTLQQLNGLFVT